MGSSLQIRETGRRPIRVRWSYRPINQRGLELKDEKTDGRTGLMETLRQVIVELRPKDIWDEASDGSA
ncbi:MAG: hypothetical protein METHAR1v1_430007 [Methanothrix sp.]|nr:MAG: hypothetical protein METHAR1v1_430007 [Methanothrix sp.]